MATKVGQISVSISVKSLGDRLRKMLVTEHSQLISKIIMDNLATTEVGLEQLFMAFSGIEWEPKYKVGDKIFIPDSHVYSWRYDEDKMREAGIIIDSRVKAVITEIHPNKKGQYTVEYQGITKEGDSKQEAVHVEERYVHLEEEWPGEDLPF